MTWLSRDFKITADGSIEELGQASFTDESVAGWRTTFAPENHQVWEIILDTPHLIVMVVPPGVDDLAPKQIRFSFNTPTK